MTDVIGFDSPFRPLDVIVRKDDAAGPVYLAAIVPPYERARDEFACEREELVLRLAWLRRGAEDFSVACTRLNAMRGVHRGPACPATDPMWQRVRKSTLDALSEPMPALS